MEEMLASLLEMVAALDGDDQDGAQERIHEAPLSVMVRGGWRAAGDCCDDKPEEFEILLSTGGPALRLYGTLNAHGEPDEVALQMQDWGTRWTEYVPAREHHDVMRRFASCFWFGE